MLEAERPARRRRGQHRGPARRRHRRPHRRRVRGRGVVVPPAALAPLRARRRHLAQPRARPPRPAGVGSHATHGGLRRRQGPASGRTRRPTRSPSATPTTRSWPRELGRAPGPPGHLRARAPAPTTGSTATGSCSTPATSLAEVGELHRAFPHDLANALAAAATVVHGGGTRGGRPRGAAGLPGAPPSGDAGGRGWRGALVRRLEGHRAPRHPRRRARLRLGRADRGRPQQGPRPRRAGRRRPTTSGPSSPSARRRPRWPPPSTGVRPVRTAASMDEAVAAAAVARSRRRRRAAVAGVRVVRLVRRPTASAATTSCAPSAHHLAGAPMSTPPAGAAAAPDRRRLGVPPAPPHRRARCRAPAPLEDLRRAARDHRHRSTCSGS